MTSRADHQLWITPEHPDDPDHDPQHDVEFDLTCPGLKEGQCRLWLECREGEHGHPDDHEWADATFHGVEHTWMNGMWCVETNDCLISWELFQNGGGNEWDVHSDVQHVPGVYAVAAEWDEGAYLSLSGEPVDP